MENQNNKKGVNAFLVILVIILVVVCALFVTGKINLSGWKCKSEETVKTKVFDYSDYANIMKKNNPSSKYGVYNINGYVSSFYLVDGKVYYDLYLDGIKKSNYLDTVKKLKKVSINIPKYDENMKVVEHVTSEKYETNLIDIISIKTYNYSQDGSLVVLFTNSNGEVYYYLTSNEGASAYNLFNENGELNINKTKLENIIDFFSYDPICNGKEDCSGTNDIYAIDVEGNLKKVDF